MEKKINERTRRMMLINWTHDIIRLAQEVAREGMRLGGSVYHSDEADTHTANIAKLNKEIEETKNKIINS